MRTSLNEIRHIEEHLLGQVFDGDALLMEVKMSLSPVLTNNVAAQKEAYNLVRKYGRKKLREEIELVEKKLFRAPEFRTFRQRIFSLFT